MRNCVLTSVVLGFLLLDNCWPQAAPSTRGSIATAQAVRVEHAPRMSGTLDDPLWLQAQPITDFREREPFEGKVPTEATEVRILYTRSEIYFGIECAAAPHSVIATQLRRDVSQELDDYFEIVIDSRHDRRNAYVFQINRSEPSATPSSPTRTNRAKPRTVIPAGTASGFRMQRSQIEAGLQRLPFHSRL